ncbi:MAG: non-canonical purine NTP pyrophosphatase [Candidatus Diapherotrites archaeon]
MNLYFVTGNKHKVREIREMLSPMGIKIIQKNLDIIEPDFSSIEKVAESKARQALEKLKKPLIVEDTGIYFKAYRNFPGALAKRIWLEIGFDGLFRLLKGKNRKAYFKSTICYIAPRKKPKLFSGEMRGRIIDWVKSPHADRLPYEKIFIPNGLRKVVVDLNLVEKNKISHRAKATRKLADYLEKIM